MAIFTTLNKRVFNNATARWIKKACAWGFPILYILAVVNLNAAGLLVDSITLITGIFSLIAGILLLRKGSWLGLLYCLAGSAALFYSVTDAHS